MYEFSLEFFERISNQSLHVLTKKKKRKWTNSHSTLPPPLIEEKRFGNEGAKKGRDE